MYASGQSHRPIALERPPNNGVAAAPPAEVVEDRDLTKGNPVARSKFPTQCRPWCLVICGSPVAGCIRGRHAIVSSSAAVPFDPRQESIG